MVSELQVQIAKVTETLETQTTLYKEALQRAKKAEKKSEALHDELMRLESELVSGDVTRDALKLEKQKVSAFLCMKGIVQVKETTEFNDMVQNTPNAYSCSDIWNIYSITNRLPYASSSLSRFGLMPSSFTMARMAKH